MCVCMCVCVCVCVCVSSTVLRTGNPGQRHALPFRGSQPRKETETGSPSEFQASVAEQYSDFESHTKPIRRFVSYMYLTHANTQAQRCEVVSQRHSAFSSSHVQI